MLEKNYNIACLKLGVGLLRKGTARLFEEPLPERCNVGLTPQCRLGEEIAAFTPQEVVA